MYEDDLDRSDLVKEALKRADHSIYVSLKYTRTGDIIRNTILRLLEACELVIVEALEHAKKKKKIKVVPATPKEKVDALKKLFKGKGELKGFLEFYDLLKKIKNSRGIGKGEYRKHVNLSVLDGAGKEMLSVDTETLKAYFEKTKEFVAFIRGWIHG
ncbi:MAG: hypothetical protein HYS32_00150 [Candidatus Woesearchaeota archaeon]|nr:MAG: hypothetical protein HYS32_00150 [Candidatus Woesearchaeota archaeon]